MIDNFLTRHLGPRKKEIQKMLSFIGVESIEELLTETIATLGENITISRYVRFAVGESDISNPKI